METKTTIPTPPPIRKPKSFPLTVQAARASRITPLLGLFVLAGWGSMIGMTSATALVAGLLVLGLVCAVWGISGVGQHGARRTLIPGLIGGVLNAGGLLLIVVAALGAYYASESPVTDADKTAVPTAANIVALHPNPFPIDPAAEQWTQHRIGPNYRLEYEYGNGKISMKSQLDLTHDVKVAQRYMSAVERATRGDWGQFELAKDPDFATIGNQSFHYRITHEGQDVGHLIAVRRGSNVVTMTLIGLRFSTTEQLRNFMQPYTDHLAVASADHVTPSTDRERLEAARTNPGNAPRK